MRRSVGMLVAEMQLLGKIASNASETAAVNRQSSKTFRLLRGGGSEAQIVDKHSCSHLLHDVWLFERRGPSGGIARDRGGPETDKEIGVGGGLNQHSMRRDTCQPRRSNPQVHRMNAVQSSSHHQASQLRVLNYNVNGSRGPAHDAIVIHRSDQSAVTFPIRLLERNKAGISNSRLVREARCRKR